MRTSVGAYALIRRRAAGGAEEWLSNWNEGWKALNLVGGHKENDESFRECCTREIVEELGLDAAADFRVAPEPEARLEYVADSRSSGEKTAYTLELFAVDLLTDAARTRIDADAAACWLTEREIRALRTADGRRAVSPTVEYVLIQAGLLPKQERYDLFVSYAHDDDQDGFVTALANAIQEEHQAFTREPLRIFFDRHGIRTGDDWEHRILGGLKAARALLSVLSPTYFLRPWCLRELETFVELEKARAWPGEPLTPVYAVTVPDADAARTAEGQAWLRSILQKQFCDLLAWRPHGAAAFRNDEVRRRLKALNERLYERVRRVEQVVRSPSTGPRHNPNFVGREDELRRLREALAAQQVAAITAVHGIGGVGKSALAAEYAHVFGDEYPGGRFWLPAENHDDLRDLFRALEAPLNLTFTDDERKDRDAGYHRVRAELERRPGTLVVLDNVNRPALLAPAHLGAYRPDADRVHVLVTMREEPPADPAGMVRPLPLDRLSPDDGRKLLQRYRDFGADEIEWQAARRIVSALGGHALSLEVVGVFVWQRNRTEPAFGYARYLEWMERKGLLAAVEGAARSGKVALSLNVEATVSRLLEPTLAGLSEPERRALEYASLLPAEWVVLPWLKELVGAEFPAAVARAEPWDPDPWLEIVTRLRGLRLFSVTQTPEIVQVHRVVQAVVCGRMGEAADSLRERLVKHALKRGKFLIDGWVDRAARWEIEPLRQLATHLLDADVTDGANLANQVFQYLTHLGRLPEARRLMRKAVAVGEKHFAPDHPELATCYSNLAVVEQDLGGLAEARRLLLQAVAIMEKHFDSEHPDLATAYSNLALVERDLGHLAKARRLLRKAVTIDEKRLDPERLGLAIHYSNLAMVEQGLGDLAEARSLLRKAVAIMEKRLDPEHPTLATNYSNLAKVERDLGNLAEARRLQQKAIAIGEKHFDPEHPLFGPFYCTLALVEYDLGDLAEARRLLQKAIAILEKNLAPDHPELATCYSNLAVVEQDLGSLAEARRLQQKAIAIREKHFDPEHPDLATSYWSFAHIEQNAGAMDQARDFARRAYRILFKRLGPEHPHTRIVRDWLKTNDPDFRDPSP